MAYSQKVSRIAPANLIGWWKQAEKYSAVAGTGTIAQTLTAILGVGTAFQSQLQIGDLLIGTGINGYVTAIADDTHLTLSSSTTVGASSFTYTRQISIDSSIQLNNGLYRNVTLNQTGIGDGLTASSYGGMTSFDNVYSAALNADFIGGELSLGGWIKPSGAGFWTDGAAHEVASFQVNAGNALELLKRTVNNTFRFYYVAGATTKLIDITTSPTAWTHFLVTISKSADAMVGYQNGVQVGSTQTGLGTWSGALDSTMCCIGAATTAPLQSFSGLLAHTMLWAGVGGVLTPTQALAVGTP